MIKLAKARLETLGCGVSDADNALLDFCRRKVENDIRNVCNIPVNDDIPAELFEVAVDRICGEFLFSKRNSGQTEMAGFDLSAAVKQIVEGDVSVSFADCSSDGERLDKLIEKLMCCGERELVKFRRIRWTK